MIAHYTKAVASLQELFQELNDQGKITPDQAEQFDEAQKVLINFHEWTKNQVNGNTKVELPWTEDKFIEAWKLWTAYKKQQFKFNYKPIGEQGALKDLADLSGGNMAKAIEIIHQSIKKGWAGFFALNENQMTKKIVNQTQNSDYKQTLFNRLT